MKNKNYKSISFVILFFLLNSLTLMGQVDSVSSGYYHFLLSDSSKIDGNIVFEDETVIQIKQLSGGAIRIKKKHVLAQEYVGYDSTRTFRIELNDGLVLIGQIISEDSLHVTITLLSGNKIIVEKEAIIVREVITSGIKDNQYWISDPNNTRLFFAPTGRGLESGTGYFAVYEVFFPMVAIGVGASITISGGFSLFPGSSEQLLYFAPKVTPFQNKDVALSVGDLYVKYPGSNNYLNIVYTVTTFSFNRGAITAAVGLETKTKKPMILVGGELRISKYAKLITENWYVWEGDFTFASLGIRFLGKHLAADFAFVVPLEAGDFYAIPWLGFAYNF